MKERNIAMVIILSILTCGIYLIAWYAMVSDEISSQLPEDARTKTGGMVILFMILSCGIYMFYWLYVQGEKLDKIKQKSNMPTSNSGLIYLLLSIFGLNIVAVALIQNEMNNLVNTSNNSTY